MSVAPGGSFSSTKLKKESIKYKIKIVTHICKESIGAVQMPRTKLLMFQTKMSKEI